MIVWLVCLLGGCSWRGEDTADIGVCFKVSSCAFRCIEASISWIFPKQSTSLSSPSSAQLLFVCNKGPGLVSCMRSMVFPPSSLPLTCKTPIPYGL